MTARANTLTPLLWKEVRTLAPTFAAALAAVLIGGPSDDYALVAIGLLGFVFGVVSLGAQTFGQEFHHRTLGLLLAQPIPRLRIYLTKFGALSITIVALTIITLPLYGERLARAASGDTQPATLLMMAACGLFLAPCLAILCRSTLAAFVFTIAIPGLLAISGDLLGTWIYGLPNAAAIDAFKADVFWRAMLAICGLATIASWWLFGRLEVIEGHREIALPDFLTFRPRTDVRSRRVIRSLVSKELRLQQITYVVALLYAATMVVLPWLNNLTIENLGDARRGVTMLHAGLVALLIGSLSSAQERHLGMLEWQAVQPVSAWKQWTVKVAVAWALAILMGVALPALLGFWDTSPRSREVPPSWMAMFVITLTTASLYLSTLCRNSMSAFVLSIPVMSIASALATTFQSLLASLIAHAYALPRYRLRPVDVSGPDLWVVVVLIAGLLWFGFVNHRTADRSVRRIALQTLALAGSFVAGLTIVIFRVVR